MRQSPLRENVSIGVGSRKLVLKFVGERANLRLVEVIFTGPDGTRNSRYGKSEQFSWSSAVRSFSLLCLKSAWSSQAEGAPSPVLSGKRFSPASSLDQAISKGSSVTWLLNVFGVTPGGDSVAKVLFSRVNPNLKAKDLDVEVRLNPLYLSHSEISIYWGREVVSKTETFEKLSNWIESTFKSFHVPRPSSEDRVQNTNVASSEQYRQIWIEENTDLPEKVERTRRLLGYGAIRTSNYLMYALRLVIGKGGESSYEFDIILYNYGDGSLTFHIHDFYFECPYTGPFEVRTSPEITTRMARDLAQSKSFYVDFKEPLKPGGVLQYQFSFRSERPGSFWEMNANARMNRYSISVAYPKLDQFGIPRFERLSPNGNLVSNRSQPVTIDAGSRFLAFWSVDYPELGSALRIRWDRHTGKPGDQWNQLPNSSQPKSIRSEA